MDPIDFLEDHAADLTALCAQLVRTPSENPPGDERRVVCALAEAARGFGLGDVSIEALAPERPNLLVRLAGAPGDRTLLLVSHVDTKPVGDTANWTMPPLEGGIQGDWLYGRGACDAKASVTAMLGAAWALAACRCPFAGELVLAFTADEEGRSEFGVRYLLEKGLTCTAAVMGEPSGIRSGFDSFHVAGRGIYNFKIAVRGRQSHSGLSDVLHPVNANLKAAELLLKLKKDFRPSCPAHPLFPDGATVNAGVWMHGGVFYGVIPGEAEVGTDIRVIPGMSRDRLRAELEAFIEDLTCADPDLDAALIEEPGPLAWSTPQEIDANHPLVLSARRAMTNVLGSEPPLAGYPATTDARFFYGADLSGAQE